MKVKTDHTFKTGKDKVCHTCGIESFDHFHRAGTDPKDFEEETNAPDKRVEEWKNELRNITDPSGMTFIDKFGQNEVVAIERFIENTLAQHHQDLMSEVERLEKAKRANVLIETKTGQVNCHDCKNLPKSPFCRHSQGWNDALTEAKNIIKSLKT